MRISLIGPVYPYRGGIAHHTTLLDRALREAGHEPQVISFRRQFPTWLYPGKSDRDPSKRTLQAAVDAEFIIDPFYPWTWKECSDRISSFQPDLIVVQWWTTFWAVPFAAISNNLRKRGYRVVYIIHNVLPHEARFWDKWLAEMALGRGDHFIAQSPHEEQRLTTFMPEAEVHLCQIPVYSLFLNGKISRGDARRKLGLPLDAPMLLFFGIVRPYKGLEILIDAMALLAREEIKPLCVIAGEFWEDKAHYLDQIEEYQIIDQLIIDDRYVPDEEVSVYFSAADVMVAPYTRGTQSAVAVSALGFGLPLIVSEQIADGINTTKDDNFYVVPAGDAQALADAIRTFLDQSGSSDMHTMPSSNDWWRMVKTLEEIAA